MRDLEGELRFANLNADDGKSNVDEVCGTGTGLAACGTTPSCPPARSTSR